MRAGDSSTPPPALAFRLLGEDGQPAAEGAYDLRFALYATETGGEPHWSEVQAGVPMRDGSFAVSLGTVELIPQEALATGALWLAVPMRGPGESSFTALTPRQSLSAEAQGVPFLGCRSTLFRCQK